MPHHLPHLAATLLGLLLALWTWPLVAELLLLSIAAALPPRRRPVAAVTLPLAVIVPAHNEETLIATTVHSLLSQSDSSVTVYVIAHNCTDQTAARASAAGATVLCLNDQIGGKGIALDYGFRHALAAGAQALLVIDADSTVSPTLTRVVAARLAAGAAALQCRYEVSNANETPRTRLAALAFLGMNVLRPRGRGRLGLSCGIFGNGFALAASTLARVPYTANSLVEDLEYHLNLIEAGLRVDFVDDATVFGEMPTNTAAASTQRARWEGGRLLMRRHWAAPLAAKVATGRLHLLEPLLDLLALPLATGAALLAAAALLGWLTAVPWLLAYALLGLATLILYALVAAALGPRPARTLAALAQAPAYLAWKLLMIPRTRLAARGKTAWIRTPRNDE